MDGVFLLRAVRLILSPFLKRTQTRQNDGGEQTEWRNLSKSNWWTRMVWSFLEVTPTHQRNCICGIVAENFPKCFRQRECNGSAENHTWCVCNTVGIYVIRLRCQLAFSRINIENCARATSALIARRHVQCLNSIRCEIESSVCVSHLIEFIFRMNT